MRPGGEQKPPGTEQLERIGDQEVSVGILSPQNWLSSACPFKTD